MGPVGGRTSFPRIISQFLVSLVLVIRRRQSRIAQGIYTTIIEVSTLPTRMRWVFL